jgi:cytochrome P450/surfactin synthase thioesterase subunit
MVDPGKALNPPLRFNPFAPGFRVDPYPHYEVARRTPGLRTLGTLVLARHADVSAALKTRAFSVDLIPQAIERHAAKLGIADVSREMRFIRNSLVFTDNPAHVRLRRLLNQVFTPEALAALRPLVAAQVDALLGALDARGFDVVEGLARPLPNRVLCEWMGVPAEDESFVARHIHSVRLMLDPGVMTRAQFTELQASLATLTAYFLRHMERPRAGGGDLVGLLMDARFEGEGLGREEVAFACIMCFVAGTETSECLIGNAVHLLLGHPDQMRLLRTDPARWTGPAIEETIRFETPLQLTKRVAVEDAEVGGVAVAAGEQILLCLAGANRDPEAFDEPDRFDITRRGPPHVGFGLGMHACLGGALARLQAQAAVQALAARYPSLRPAGDVAWQTHSLILRGLDRLPVRPARSPWLRTDSRAGGPGAPSEGTPLPQLVCFPHAGGSASSFAAWPARMPPALRIHRAEVPAAADLSARQVRSLIRELAAAFREALARGAVSPPFAFYGHSLGALVAYELALHLREAGEPEPVALFVSGRRSPGHALRRTPLCELPDEALAAELQRFGGLPDALLKHPRWLSAALPRLREELALSDLYPASLHGRLDCPVHAFKGEHDPILDNDELAGWQQVSQGPFTMETLTGSHFFDDAGLLRLQQRIAQALEVLGTEAAHAAAA